MGDKSAVEFPTIEDRFQMGRWYMPFLGLPEEGKLDPEVVSSHKISDTVNFFHITLDRKVQPVNISGSGKNTDSDEKAEQEEGSEGYKRSHMTVIIDGPRPPGLAVYARIADVPNVIYKGTPITDDGELICKEWKEEKIASETGRKAYSRNNPFTEPSLSVDKIEIMICDAKHPAREPLH